MIYFIQVGETGPIKIGWAGNPEKRIAQLRIGCPFPLQLLGLIPATQKIERAIHRRLEADRLSGEWFHPTLEVRRWATLAAVIDGRTPLELPVPEVEARLGPALRAEGLL